MSRRTESSSARTAPRTSEPKLKKRAEVARNSSDQNLLVRNANIWTGNGFSKGSILIEDGKIKRRARKQYAPRVETVDASGLYALPGLIDVHVHLRGLRLSYKEDFASGSAAAAAGGFTTVLDMPNTLPPTDSVERLVEKQKKAAEKAYVNIGFHAAATPDLKTLRGLVRAGAFSLKLYMPKPIARFDVTDDAEIGKLFDGARKSRAPVTVHAEELATPAEDEKFDTFQQMARFRSPNLETKAVERIGRVQRRSSCRIHLCHLTLASTLSRVAESRSVTSEVTPHHLLLSSKTLGRLGWKAWMVPPLRDEMERKALLNATSSGLCDVVASDHAPHTIMEKNRDPSDSSPGVPGLETTLPLMLTLVNKGILSFSQLVRLLAQNPAKIFGLKSKGKLRSGFDGDLILVDFKKRSRIDSTRFFSKVKFSPFDGFRTKGSVVATIVGGTLVYYKGDLAGPEGCGSVIRSSYLS